MRTFHEAGHAVAGVPHGPVATALFGKADELLEVPPQIENVDVLAAKLPG